MNDKQGMLNDEVNASWFFVPCFFKQATNT